MLCKKPYMGGTSPYGCGQCLPCRINKSRQKMWRQLLESFSHEHCAFVTLTYNDKYLPANLSLEPDHLSLWLKRLRKRVAPIALRFFASGEYGTEGTRGINPHYHVSLFGLSGHTDEHGSGNRRFLRHAGAAQIISDTWGMGDVWTREFNAATALYVSKYTIKKMTSPDDPRLNGLHPEFCRASNRPGIGAATIPLIARLLSSSSGVEAMEKNGDVPRHVALGKKPIPLDRYMLQKLREGVGFTPEYIATLKLNTQQEKQIELLSLLSTALDDPETFASPSTVYAKEVRQRILNAESQFKLWGKQHETL